jgi:hypothetical protein
MELVEERDGAFWVRGTAFSTKREAKRAAKRLIVNKQVEVGLSRLMYYP